MKTIKDRLFSLLFIGLVFFSLSSCSTDAERGVLTIRNGMLELDFDQQSGALLSLHDLINSHEYLYTIASECSPWLIEMPGPEGIKLGTFRDGKILVDFTLDREDLCIVEIIPNS